MNKPVVRLFGLVVVLFAVLIGFTSRWTVFEANALRENPANHRVLLQVSLDEAAAADELFSVLMGEDVEARRAFIQRNAKDVRFLDI